MSIYCSVHITKSEIKFLRSLAQKKVRDREKKFMIEGWKSLKDALNSDFRIDLVAVLRRQAENPEYRSFIDDMNSREVIWKELTEVELKQVADTVHAQGVIATIDQRTRIIDDILATGPTLVVVADRIADPGNLGTMVRTCDWFGANALVMSEGCVELYNHKVVRSTSGSIFHLPVVEHTDLHTVLNRLRVAGFRCFATSGDSGKSYVNAEYGEKNAIIIGNEAGGIHTELMKLADAVVGIPRRGKAESLNAGVACGILLAHLRNRR